MIFQPADLRRLGTQGTVSCAFYNKARKLFVVTLTNCSNIFLIDPIRREIFNEFEVEGKLRTCCWSPQGNMVGCGSEEGTVFVIRIDSGEIVFELRQDTCDMNRIRALAISPDEQKIAISTYRSQVEIYDLHQQETKKTPLNYLDREILETDTDEIQISSPSIKTVGKYLAIGKDDNDCESLIFNWESLVDHCKTLSGHSRGIRSISGLGNWIATGSYDSTVRIYKDFNFITVLREHTRPVLDLYCSSDGLMVIGSEDQSLTVYDLNRQKIIVAHESLGDWVRGVAMDGESLFAITADFKLHSRKLKPPKCAWKFAILYILTLEYYYDVVSDVLMLNEYYEGHNSFLLSFSIFFIIFPNIIQSLSEYDMYKDSVKDYLKNIFLNMFFLKFGVNLIKDLRTPTYIGDERDHRRNIRELGLLEPLYEAIPETMIALYFIIAESQFTTLPLLSLSISVFTVALSTSSGISELEYKCLPVCLLFCYRLFELSVRSLIIVLFAIYVDTYWPFIIIPTIALIQYLLMYPKKSDKKATVSNKITKVLLSIANSFTFIYSEEPTVKRDPDSGQFVPEYTNTILLGCVLLYKRNERNIKRNVIAQYATVRHAVIQHTFNFLVNAVLGGIIWLNAGDDDLYLMTAFCGLLIDTALFLLLILVLKRFK